MEAPVDIAELRSISGVGGMEAPVDIAELRPISGVGGMEAPVDGNAKLRSISEVGRLEP